MSGSSRSRITGEGSSHSTPAIAPTVAIHSAGCSPIQLPSAPPATEPIDIAILVDNLPGGVAAAAFVAYFSSLSRGAFSASQYALLTSFMALGRIFFAGG